VPVAKLARVIASRGLRAGDINGLMDVEARTEARIPLATVKVPAGFPSPADDYLDRPLDFNELLIENPAATFAVRVAGDSMTGAGIFPDDIAIVDRARAPKDRSVVLALVDGGFTLKRYRKRGGRVWLQAENPAYADTEITEGMSFEIWGVVSKAIRML
jgi:DNA polymerase V